MLLLKSQLAQKSVFVVIGCTAVGLCITKRTALLSAAVAVKLKLPVCRAVSRDELAAHGGVLLIRPDQHPSHWPETSPCPDASYPVARSASTATSPLAFAVRSTQAPIGRDWCDPPQ